MQIATKQLTPRITTKKRSTDFNDIGSASEGDDNFNRYAANGNIQFSCPMSPDSKKGKLRTPKRPLSFQKAGNCVNSEQIN